MPPAETTVSTAPPPINTPFRIALRDLWPIIINAAFALIGLVLLPSEPNVAIVTIAFFGSGAYFLGLLQWRRYQDHKLQLTSVDVVGGVRIYPKRSFMVLMGLWLLGLGTVLVVFGGAYPVLFLALGAFVALCGLVLTILAALRLHPPGFLQFEPDDFIIGQRGWQVHVPWDSIDGVEVGELVSNPVVRLDVYDRSGLVIKPASASAKAFKIMDQGMTMFGWGPFNIMPMHYGIPAPILADAIRRYAFDRPSRRTLGARALNGRSNS